MRKFLMLPGIRQIHTRIVAAYIPEDHENELAEALWKWQARRKLRKYSSWGTTGA